MLDFMRKNANSWLMVLLFGIIIFVFAINFGPWAGHEGGALPFAAEVNGRVITLTEFNQIYAGQMRQMQSYRPGYTPQQAETEGLKAMILDHMVSQELLAQTADDNGLIIPDTELAQIIRKRIFGDAKDFDAEQYKRIIHSVFQSNEAQFEGMVRRELLAQRAAELITTGANISDDELKQAFTDKKNRVSLEYVRIDPAYFTQVKEPSADEAKAFADKHPDQIKAYYDAHIADYRAPKQVHARHILVKASATAPQTEKDAAKAKLTAAQKRIAAGEDFAKVAKEVSQDGSAQSGGDLGYFGEGAMVKPFEKVAFELNKGQVSGIVETPFGYHLIKVEDIRMPTHQEIDSVKNTIAIALLQKDARSVLAKEYANGLLAKMKAGAATSALGITKNAVNPSAPKEDVTGLFAQKARFIPGIGENSELAQVAFTLTKENAVASQVFDVNGKYFLVKLKERESADMTQFDKEKTALKDSLLYMKKRQFMQEYITSLKGKATIKYNPTLEKPGHENLPVDDFES